MRDAQSGPQSDDGPRPPVECRQRLDFFLGRALGRRERLEALVRDRLPALDREAVRARREPGLGALDGCQLLAEVVGKALVELVLVEVGCDVARPLVVGEPARVLVPVPRERLLDPRALGGQKLACPVGIHRRRSYAFVRTA